MKNGVVILTLILSLPTLTGCQSTKWSQATLRNLNPVKHLSSVTEKSNNESEFEEPVRMAVIWTDGQYKQAGKPPVKGFGARIYFYGESGEPIKADGELVVYGYDDNENHEGYSADKKFVFRQSEMQSHFSESALGDSYSVWIPWEKVGGYRKSVALLPIFKTASGTVLRGDQSVNMLPGKDPLTNQETKSEIKIKHSIHYRGLDQDDSRKVVTAGYVESDDDQVRQRQPLEKAKETTTIAMPRSMVEKLAKAPAQFNHKRANQRDATRVRRANKNPNPVPKADPSPTENTLTTPSRKRSKPVAQLYGKSGFEQ